jgi:signal transduction histidine kinase
VEAELYTALSHEKLSLENRTHLYLLGKESVYNAAKYSQATRVEIRLKSTEKGFELTIADNGIGFERKDIEAAQNGNGLLNMEQRAKEMKATFSLISGYGSGTCIKVEGPIG